MATRRRCRHAGKHPRHVRLTCSRSCRKAAKPQLVCASYPFAIGFEASDTAADRGSLELVLQSSLYYGTLTGFEEFHHRN
jgi:hypothetical protein